MDWNGSLRTFVSRPPESSFSFLYNYDQYPGIDMKYQAMAASETLQGFMPGMEKNMMNCNNQEKKKRLSNDQLESLERSFREEIKLDPDRKMKLAKELGLQPRQIAVWFQNRRARWKAKQLERLYDSLKQEFDSISREKQNLQEEVMKLKTMLTEQASRKQVSTVYTDISGGEETVESTSVDICSLSKTRGTNSGNHQIAECSYIFNAENYNPVSPPFWGSLPTFP